MPDAESPVHVALEPNRAMLRRFGGVYQHHAECHGAQGVCLSLYLSWGPGKVLLGRYGVGNKSMLGLLGLRSEQELAKRKETLCQAEEEQSPRNQVP